MNVTSMACEISQTFYFDAAHTLDRAIDTVSSKRVHGHTYNAEVFLTGYPDPKTGMVIDLGFVRQELALLRDQLDHHLLDEVEGLGLTTLENLCYVILAKLLPALPALTSVRVWRNSIGDSCRISR